MEWIIAIASVTADMAPRPMIAILPAIFIVLYLFLFALIVIVLIRLSKFLLNVPKEQKLLRFEMGKLAQEVHEIKEQLKPEKRD